MRVATPRRCGQCSNVNMAVSSSYHCHYCSFVCTEWKENTKHMFQCHSSVPNFRCQCRISGCSQSFRTYAAFTSHLQRKHQGCDYSQHLSSPSVTSINNFDLLEECTIDTRVSEVSKAKRSSALLLLALKENHLLTQSAVNFAIGQMKQMSAYVLEEAKTNVMKRIGDHTVLDDCFDIDPFDGLGTEYLQTKFYRENFDLVVSSQCMM